MRIGFRQGEAKKWLFVVSLHLWLLVACRADISSVYSISFGAVFQLLISSTTYLVLSECFFPVCVRLSVVCFAL